MRVYANVPASALPMGVGRAFRSPVADVRQQRVAHTAAQRKLDADATISVDVGARSGGDWACS